MAKKIILVADDNAMARRRLHTLLRSAGYRVTTVATGQDALAAMLLRTPDLALVDLQMPELDGIGVVHAMRADPELRTVPAIALSAFALPRGREYALAAGFDAYLRKPAPREKLLDEVRRRIG